MAEVLYDPIKAAQLVREQEAIAAQRVPERFYGSSVTPQQQQQVIQQQGIARQNLQAIKQAQAEQQQMDAETQAITYANALIKQGNGTPGSEFYRTSSPLVQKYLMQFYGSVYQNSTIPAIDKAGIAAEVRASRLNSGMTVGEYLQQNPNIKLSISDKGTPSFVELPNPQLRTNPVQVITQSSNAAAKNSLSGAGDLNADVLSYARTLLHQTNSSARPYGPAQQISAVTNTAAKTGTFGSEFLNADLRAFAQNMLQAASRPFSNTTVAAQQAATNREKLQVLQTKEARAFPGGLGLSDSLLAYALVAGRDIGEVPSGIISTIFHPIQSIENIPTSALGFGQTLKESGPKALADISVQLITAKALGDFAKAAEPYIEAGIAKRLPSFRAVEINPELGEIIPRVPSEVPSIATRPGLTLKQLARENIADFQNIKPGKLTIELTPPGKGFGMSLREQASFAGLKDVTLASAQRNLLSFLKTEILVNKPIEIGESELERSFFASPFNKETTNPTLRISRLGLQDLNEPISPLDLLTADITLAPLRPQILVFEGAEIEDIPKSLTENLDKAIKDASKRSSFEKAYLKYQLKVTGKFKPLGFASSSEEEVTLSPNELVRKVRGLGNTVIQGRRVSLIQAAVATDADLSSAAKSLLAKSDLGVLKESEASTLSKLLRKETGLDYYAEGKRYVSPYKSFLQVASLLPRANRQTLTSYARTPLVRTNRTATPRANPRVSRNKSPTSGSPDIPRSEIDYPLSPNTSPPVRSPPTTITLPPTNLLPPGKRRQEQQRNRKRSFGQGYNVFVRRKGKFTEVGENLPIGRALARGQRAAIGSIARTFRLKASGLRTSLPDVGSNLRAEIFRRPTAKSKLNKPLTYVQRSKFSLSSKGEQSDIRRSRSLSKAAKFDMKKLTKF